MTLEEYRKKNKKKNKKYLSNLLTRILIVIIIIFVLLIFVNFNPDLKNKIKNTLFKTDYNFSYLNKVYNKYFADVFDKVNDKDVAVVSKNSTKKQEKYKDGVKVYLDNTSEIKLLHSGIVVYIGNKKNYGKTIIIQQSNGIDAWYGNIDTTKVKLYDYVEKDKTIATGDKYYYLVYEKDGKKLDYNEANKKD